MSFIYREKYTKCGTCQIRCPPDAVVIAKHFKIDQRKYIKYFSCVENCPEEVIKIRVLLYLKLFIK